MTNQQLSALFNRIHKDYFNRKYRHIRAEFHSFRGIKHAIEWSPWRIQIKVSDHFRQAPLSILEIIAIILISKIYKMRVQKEIKRQYQEYVTRLEDKLPPRRQNSIESYNPCGKNYDLDEIFNELNQKYFENKLDKPILGWSRNKSYRRLGFYDHKRNLLVISLIFDSRQVPPEVIKSLVYHEMLHIIFPVIHRNGRRIIHPLEFKRKEKKFPNYAGIQKWMKMNLGKL
jgi:predicted metal-dependent hydrolase